MGEEEITLLHTPPLITEPERCSGCGRCIAACPEKLYGFEYYQHRKTSRNKTPAKCTLCGRCVTACPLDIIL